jgi:hypothetical protein
MKIPKFFPVLFLFLIASGFILKQNQVNNQSQSSEIAKPAKMLRHVVLLKFKDEASAADIKKVENAFRALPSKIKEIKALEWGTNNSPENLAQGFTHCFFLSFADEKGREAYLPHPDHKAFGALLGPYLDKVLVVDYWAAN